MIATYLEAAKETVEAISLVAVEQAVEMIRKTHERGGTVFTMGNGGSAATASHFVNDLLALGYKAVCLSDNVPTIMAIANDYGYEEVFKRQLETLLGYGDDIIVAFSCSGESENVVRVVNWAHQNKNHTETIAFCGHIESTLAEDAHLAIPVPGSVQHQEDAHLMLCHAIYCELRGTH